MKITIIPGLPKRVCPNCGAKHRANESQSGKCWKCAQPLDVGS